MQKFSTFKTQIVTKGEEQPLTCPVCDFVLRDDLEVASVKKESACTECTLNFKYIHLDKWEDGWRPSTEEARSKMHI